MVNGSYVGDDRTNVVFNVWTAATVATSAAPWRAAKYFDSLCVFEQRRHVGPQAPPIFPLRRRKFGQRRLVAHTREIGVRLPVAQALADELLLVRRASGPHLGISGQIGAQPIERLLPQIGALRVAQLAGVLAFAGGCEGGVLIDMTQGGKAVPCDDCKQKKRPRPSAKTIRRAGAFFFGFLRCFLA
jgi:hypothetical protein